MNTRKVTSDDSLQGHDVRFSHKHRTALEVGSMGLNLRRHRGHGSSYQVVRYYMREFAKPEEGNSCQKFSLGWYSLFEGMKLRRAEAK
jgi:hypothetical protein